MKAHALNWLLLAAGTILGLTVGFGLGFYAAPRSTVPPHGPSVHEYVGEARHVNFETNASEFDVHYPAAYVDRPELTILTEEMNYGFDYQLVEQRRDGFRIKIGSSMRRGDKPNGVPWLKYRVKGVPVPTGTP